MADIGILEYEGRRPETVEILEEDADVILLDPEEEHPEEVRELDLYHTARVREGSIKDYRTAVDLGVSTVHEQGWLELWNERYSISELLEEVGVEIPDYELWNSMEDAKESDLEFPVLLQPNAHFGPGRHDTEIVSREGLENSELLGEDTYVSEFIEHDTLYKIYRVGENVKPVKFENHSLLCDQRGVEMEYPEVQDWMEELATKIDSATGEKLWNVDLVEGDQRFAVDLNMVVSTRRMQDGPEIYANYILEYLE